MIASATALSAQTSGTALLRHAPVINSGTIAGSLQQMTAENVTLNGSAAINGQLRVPGSPTVRINGNATSGGTMEGTGAATPVNYTVTLNGSASLGGLVTRTNPVVLPIVGAPPSATGTRVVTLNTASDRPGDFATLRHLTATGNAGQISIPSGAYGDFTASGNGGFTLGIAGATQASVYSFQSLKLDGNGRLSVVGPVVITVGGPISARVPMGAAEHPEWLTIRITSEDFDLSGKSTTHAYVVAPSSAVTINGGAELIGGLVADRLTVSDRSVLRLINLAPRVVVSAPVDGSVQTSPIPSVTVRAQPEDVDGYVTKVEFLAGTSKLGDATSAPFQVSWTNVRAGTYALTAVATDNSGATTVSAPVTLIANAAPTATLSAPARAPRGGGVLLTATATDSDGSIAKVEFYRDGSLIGTVTAPTGNPLRYLLTDQDPLRLGSYTYSVRTYDNMGLSGDSPSVVVAVLASLPYTANFEAIEGYQPGALAGQLGWAATSNAATVTDQAAYNGARSVALAPGTPPVRVSQVFAPYPGHDIVFLDFFARPVAEVEVGNSTTFDVEGARFAFVGSNSGTARLHVFDGDGTGGGAWRPTSFTAPLSAGNQVEVWTRLTTRLDFAHKTWDLYAGGNLVAVDLRFREDSATYLSTFGVRGDATTITRLDYLFAAAENPLFADTNNNGIDDAWETAHGLSLTTANRNLSPAGNGVSVIHSYLNGIDPNDYYAGVPPVITSLVAENGVPGADGLVAVRVTSFDGSVLGNAPIGFEVGMYGAQLSASVGGPREPLVNVRTDAQGVGRAYVDFGDVKTALMMVIAKTGQTGTSILVTLNAPSVDADHNGLPDDWEIKFFGHTGVDPKADDDGDGVTNLDEFRAGTSPTDFFNGVVPLVQAENGGNPDASDALIMRIRKPDGTPWPFAPATFEITSGDRKISATPGGPNYSMKVEVRADANGVAKAYLEPL